MRESLWLFPAVETAHIIGFSVLVGTVVAFDLRVLGLSKSISVRVLARHLLPWSVGALVVIVPTGLLLFLAQASGLPPEAIKLGAQVSVVAYANRSKAEEARAERITADGKTVELR